MKLPIRELRNKDILVWKGFKWHRLLKFDSYHITSLLIQLVTLSRYTHTAIFLEDKNKKTFLLQASIKGLEICAIDKSWILEEIEKGNIEVVEHMRNDDVFLFEKQTILTKKIFGKYSYKNLLNQIPINLFNKSFVKKSNIYKEAICSELTQYAFTLDYNSFLFSPSDIVEQNFIITKLIKKK